MAETMINAIFYSGSGSKDVLHAELHPARVAH
jgi:hypothetical protein